MNLLAKALVAVSVLAVVSPAHAERTPKPVVPNLVVNGGLPTGAKIKQNCTGKTFCNVLISKCAEEGGSWSAQKHDSKGRPVKGNCVY
ncbi:MAG: hypothetical protein AAF748_09785 [Pseudomonadota bacterium]